MATSSASPARSRLGLLRHPEFRKLWSAETISQYGTQVSALGIPLIAALYLNVTPFEFGLIATIEFLPFILLSLPAGVWVDRLRRRPILIVGDVGRGVALLSIPIAYELHALTIWQLYAVGFINGCFTVFFDVAYQSYLPSLVERNDILEGNSKLEISRSSAQMFGPGISGFLIGILTAPVAIILDSLSFFGSAALVFRIRRKEPPPTLHDTVDGKGPGMRAEIGAGLRYVLSHAYLRSIAACTGISNFFSNMLFAVLVLYLVRELSVTAAELGIAFSVGSVGFLVGAVLANRVAARIGVGWTIIISAFVFGPSGILIAAAPREIALPAASLSLLVGGFAGAIYNINQVSFRQAITPLRMQGRMNATMRFIVWGTIPIGSLVGGFLGGTIGLRDTLWVGAIGGVFSAVPLLFSPLRSLREMPEAESGDGPPASPGPTARERDIDTLGEAVDETPHPVPGSPSPGDG